MIAKFDIILAVSAALVSASPITGTSPATDSAAPFKRWIYEYCDEGSWEVDHGTILYAKCRADDGLIRPEQIDLNSCLGNNNGRPIHHPGGGYGDSCNTTPGSQQMSSGTTVCITCTAMDGSQVYSCIQVDEFATVNDGRLKCKA